MFNDILYIYINELVPYSFIVWTDIELPDIILHSFKICLKWMQENSTTSTVCYGVCRLLLSSAKFFKEK